MAASDTALDAAPNPFFEPKLGVHLGAYVKTARHGYTGRVHAVHYGCPEGAAWQSMQSYDVTAAPTKRWVSILVHGGGSVAFPETLVEPIAPFALDNNSAVFHFGKRDDQ